jgi:hypothetical protein
MDAGLDPVAADFPAGDEDLGPALLAVRQYGSRSDAA